MFVDVRRLTVCDWTLVRAIAGWRAMRLTMVRVGVTHLLLCITILLASVPAVQAQTGVAGPEDPNSVLTNTVLTVPLQGYSIAGLVTHVPDAKAFKYGIALFPGYPSIMKLREEGGQPRFELGGNFLIRSRRHWLDRETLVISIDAPSDQWGSFSQQFRQNARYGGDVAALLAEAGRRYGVMDWTLVGTSEGSVSAFHVARMNRALAPRLLWVHHEEDPCAYTPYREALRYAQMTRSPLLAVRGGGPSRGAPCEARSAHGFVGVERATVLAMRSWVKTGVTPADVVGD
jgi:hypothetical protein